MTRWLFTVAAGLTVGALVSAVARCADDRDTARGLAAALWDENVLLERQIAGLDVEVEKLRLAQ